MTKYLLLGITITAIIVGARFYMKPMISDSPMLSKENPEQITNGENSIAQGEVAQPEYVPKDSATQEATFLDSTSQPSAISSTAEKVLWLPSENQQALPDRFLRKGLNPLALSISHSTIQSLKIGDEISLSIPQLAQSYPMDIEQVRKHKNGDRTVSGHLKNTDLPYSVIITSGVQASFATINTPDGSYVMEAEGDSGWIMSIANLDYLIDTNLDDFQIPDFNR